MVVGRNPSVRSVPMFISKSLLLQRLGIGPDNRIAAFDEQVQDRRYDLAARRTDEEES